MPLSSKHKIVETLLDSHGKTFTEEIGIYPLKNTPSHLFRLLCSALLFSTRINHEIAIKAAQALNNQGYTTPRKMLSAGWDERTRLLNRSGYARYDEKTSTTLEDVSRMILDKYQGDLRNLREEARYSMREERKLLKEFKGIGDTGVNIFFREVQDVWEEVFPFIDERALESAGKIGLPEDPQLLKKLVKKENFSRLADALVRIQLKKEHQIILKEAKKII